MVDRLKILIVGGYGVFGGRLVALLENEPRLSLIVAGRSFQKAGDFCRSRRDAAARLIPAAFDRAARVSAQLASYAPNILVDASGPFQAYGENPYAIIKACIAQRVHYLDLADGADFVAGVSAFNAEAKAAGLFVLSGASSFPVLTAAICERLAPGFARINAITGGIAPSPFAGVGENVVRAIASYAGRPVLCWRQGALRKSAPFTEQKRYTIAPPGLPPLENRLFSLVDVPDLRALPQAWPSVRDVWMGAAPVPEILHRALIMFATLRRWGLMRSLEPLAPLMVWAVNRLRWGAHRGGMFVEIEGEDEGGEPKIRSWHMLAEGDDGPFIPSMAVEALVRKALDGQAPAPGARSAAGAVSLADYERLFAARAIRTGIREHLPDSAPLFERVLQSAWAELPQSLRALHGAASAKGRVTLQRGRNPLGRLVARAMGFPDSGADLPLAVHFEARAGAETWRRAFGAQNVSSTLSLGRGKSASLLCERFGAFEAAMALTLENGALIYHLRRWTVAGLALPLWLAPRIKARETEREGRFYFEVEIAHALCGRIVSYAGWLTPESALASPPANA